jgi:AraC-like DNA-binding protein
MNTAVERPEGPSANAAAPAMQVISGALSVEPDLKTQSQLRQGRIERLSRRIYRSQLPQPLCPGGKDMVHAVCLDGYATLSTFDLQTRHVGAVRMVADEPAWLVCGSTQALIQVREPGADGTACDGPCIQIARVPPGTHFDLAVGSGRLSGALAVLHERELRPGLGLTSDDLAPVLQALEAQGEQRGLAVLQLLPSPALIGTLHALSQSRFESEWCVLRARGQLLQLLADVFAQAHALKSQPPRALAAADLELAARARLWLQREATANPSSKALAAHLHTNTTKLRLVFRAQYGITMEAFVQACRIEVAKRLLEEDQQPLARVADRAGYGHQSSFTTAFRAAVGITPNSYRLAHRRQRAVHAGPGAVAGAGTPAGAGVGTGAGVGV